MGQHLEAGAALVRQIPQFKEQGPAELAVEGFVAFFGNYDLMWHGREDKRSTI